MKTYSITYKSFSDPSNREQSALINECKNKSMTVIDEFPGAILVSGNEDALKEIIACYSQWEYSCTKQVNI